MLLIVEITSNYQLVRILRYKVGKRKGLTLVQGVFRSRESMWLFCNVGREVPAVRSVTDDGLLSVKADDIDDGDENDDKDDDKDKDENSLHFSSIV